MMVSLYYVIQEMHSFSMRPAKYFNDKPLPKYLDPKTVLIYRPHPVYDTGGKQWEQLSNCWQLKINLKKNWSMYCTNSTTQRCPKEIIKIFLIEDFFHLTPVSMTPVANLELRRSLRIFEKIWKGPNGIIRGLGETDSWKKREAKYLILMSL